ncbi:MAG: SPFH domain-containing protein [Planctomycetota bacterium]
MIILSLVVINIVALFVFIIGIRIVRPTHRGLVERLGKYSRMASSGFNWIIPIIDTMRYRNMTEQLADVEPQDIITKDNLNARVDLQVYFKVKNEEENIKKSYYQVDDYKYQIIALAQTTARNVIGDMKFVDVNNQRNELNTKLADVMRREIENWGVEVVRVELKEITPPKEVQETMNRVIQAQNQKDAAIDFATAVETEADGKRRAAIKEADGIKQADILKAEGQAQAIKLVNESAEKYFIGNAKELRRMEMVEKSLKDNSKIIVTKDGINPALIIGGTNEKISDIVGSGVLSRNPAPESDR